MPSDDKPYESIMISLDDVATYHETSKDPHFVSDWLALSSIVQIDGLKKLRTALNSKDGTLPDIDQEALLKDLERVAQYESTRSVTIEASGEQFELPPTLTNENGQKLPEFKKEFHQEVNKVDQERSDEFKKFLQEYSEMAATKHCPESICAKMLIELSKENATKENLQKKLNEALAEFKSKYAAQSAEDIGKRNLIIFKDPKGETQPIDIQQLKSLDSSILSGEQKNFIESCWQQGTFSSGWLATNRAMLSGSVDGPPTYKNRPLLVDCSKEGQVKLFNQTSAQSISADSTRSLITGTLLVDISKMSGEEFVIGCTSSKPRIDIVISREDRNFKFDLPEGLKRYSSNAHDNIRIYVKNEYTQGYRNSFLQSNLLKETVRMILGENDPVVLQSNIRQAMQTIMHEQGIVLSDKEKINRIKLCTEEQVTKYSQSKHGILNDAKVDEIAQDLNIILEPLCHSEKDKELLKNNTKKIVRECASLAGDKMSWSQSWHRFADKIQDLAAKLINKKTDIQKLYEQSPKIITTLRENMKSVPEAGVNISPSNSPSSTASKQPDKTTTR